jgi:type III secretory pathway component EscS
MAKINRNSRASEQSPRKRTEIERKLVAFKISAPAPHRQLGLLAITVILNTLLLASVICFIIALYQIASDSDDASNILPGVLTLIAVSTTTHVRENRADRARPL